MSCCARRMQPRAPDLSKRRRVGEPVHLRTHSHPRAAIVNPSNARSVEQRVKDVKRGLNRRYAKADDAKGVTQVVTTLLCLALAWVVAVWSVAVSLWLTAAA